MRSGQELRVPDLGRESLRRGCGFRGGHARLLVRIASSGHGKRLHDRAEGRASPFPCGTSRLIAACPRGTIQGRRLRQDPPSRDSQGISDFSRPFAFERSGSIGLCLQAQVHQSGLFDPVHDGDDLLIGE